MTSGIYCIDLLPDQSRREAVTTGFNRHVRIVNRFPARVTVRATSKG